MKFNLKKLRLIYLYPDDNKIKKLAQKLNLSEEEMVELFITYEAEYEKLVSQGINFKAPNEQYTIAFQLGQAILESTRSLDKLKKLPARLIELRALSQKRKIKKSTKVLPDQSSKKYLEQLDTPSIAYDEKLTSGIETPEQKYPENGKVSILGWPEPEKNGKFNVLTVLDDFSRVCFSQQANLLEPRPDNWYYLMQRDNPDFIFVESAWKGKGASWQYRIAKYNHPLGSELDDMLAISKEKNIPTVFWNKEDPVHFDHFIHNAKKFDYVFTTAEEAIQLYQKIGCKNVYALPFAAEKSLHNPIGSAKRIEKICFAGSYYANRFKDRENDQLMLLQAAEKFGLEIYDRNYNSTALDFRFPGTLANSVIGSLGYEELCQKHKEYKIFLNVNSVPNSKTMFSRRIFELLACGTPVVSTKSIGIEEILGKDIVWVVDTPEQAEEAIHTLMTDKQEWKRRSLAGIRSIFKKHTYDHRFREILNTIGLANCIEKKDKIVAVMALVGSKSQAEKIIESFEKQHQDFFEKRLLLVQSRAFSLSKEILKEHVLINKKIFTQEFFNSYLLEQGINYLGKMKSEYEYGSHYIEDLLLSFNYQKLPIVMKPVKVLNEYSYNFMSEAQPNTWLVDLTQCQTLDLYSIFLNHSDFEENTEVFLADSANISSLSYKMNLSQRTAHLLAIDI
ncbi:MULTISPECIES: glycosyltransferase [Acinetobacter]|uniref:CgeB family protein n=1 Tax=Acinetobacter TaxID=469 RepID=UPI001F4A0CBB|nr:MULTISPECIES: glycosyltransferase [Acinetobacter]MCH7379964.1 glycosyltransferase [Acinetobacter higginsii]